MAINMQLNTGPSILELQTLQRQRDAEDRARRIAEQNQMWAMQDRAMKQQKIAQEEMARKKFQQAIQPSPLAPFANMVSPLVGMISQDAQKNLMGAMQPSDQQIYGATRDYAGAVGDVGNVAEMQLKINKLNAPKAPKAPADLVEMIKGSQPWQLPGLREEFKRMGLTDAAIDAMIQAAQKPVNPPAMSDMVRMVEAMKQANDPNLTPEQRQEAMATVNYMKEARASGQPVFIPANSSGQIMTPEGAKPIPGFVQPPKDKEEKPLTGDMLDYYIAAKELGMGVANPQEFMQAFNSATPEVISQIRERSAANAKNKSGYGQFEVEQAMKSGESLRNSLMQNPTVKAASLLSVKAEEYNSIKEQAKTGQMGGAAQIATLYQFLQGLDGSVVRPSEVAMTGQTLSLRDRAYAAYDSYQKGQVAPEIFIESLDKYYKAIVPAVEKHVDKIVMQNFEPYMKKYKNEEAKTFLRDIMDGVRSNYRTIVAPVSGAEPQGLIPPVAEPVGAPTASGTTGLKNPSFWGL